MRCTETVPSEPILSGNFRKDDCTGGLQACDDRRVPLGYRRTERLERGGRRKPGDIDEILHDNGDSMQRRAPALCLALGIEGARFFQRLGIQGDDGYPFLSPPPPPPPPPPPNRDRCQTTLLAGTHLMPRDIDGSIVVPPSSSHLKESLACG